MCDTHDDDDRITNTRTSGVYACVDETSPGHNDTESVLIKLHMFTRNYMRPKDGGVVHVCMCRTNRGEPSSWHDGVEHFRVGCIHNRLRWVRMCESVCVRKRTKRGTHTHSHRTAGLKPFSQRAAAREIARMRAQAGTC